MHARTRRTFYVLSAATAIGFGSLAWYRVSLARQSMPTARPLPLVQVAKPAQVDSVDMVFVSAASQQEIDEASSQITALLHERHRIQPAQEDDFIVRSLNDMAKASESASKVMTNLLLITALRYE